MYWMCSCTPSTLTPPGPDYTRAVLAGRKKKPTSHETSSLILYILPSTTQPPLRRAVFEAAAPRPRGTEARESSLHAVTNERRALVRTYL